MVCWREFRVHFYELTFKKNVFLGKNHNTNRSNKQKQKNSGETGSIDLKEL